MRVKNIKVVIVGQDPYPQPGVATGLAFAISDGAPLQPSLAIIQSELALNYYNDISWGIQDKTLVHWEDQGVLLLNASLSCAAYTPESADCLFIQGKHSYLWRIALMENLFKWMSENLKNVVFIFMGRKAQYYNNFINVNRHTTINTFHPVADHRTGMQMFIGSKCFNNANDALQKYEKEQIEW